MDDPIVPEPAVEPQEPPNDDPLAEERAKLEAERAEVEAAKAANAKRERELQRGFEEAARRQQQAAPVSDETPDLDEASKAALEKWAAEKGILQTPAAVTEYIARNEFERAAEKAGIDYDELVESAMEAGLAPRDNSPEAFRQMAEAAAKLRKSKTFDADAERARIKEELLKEMEANGVSVESITPKRDEAPVNLSMMDDDRVDPEAKFEALRKDKRYKDLL